MRGIFTVHTRCQMEQIWYGEPSQCGGPAGNRLFWGDAEITLCNECRLGVESVFKKLGIPYTVEEDPRRNSR